MGLVDFLWYHPIDQVPSIRYCLLHWGPAYHLYSHHIGLVIPNYVPSIRFCLFPLVPSDLNSPACDTISQASHRQPLKSGTTYVDRCKRHLSLYTGYLRAHTEAYMFHRDV